MPKDSILCSRFGGSFFFPPSQAFDHGFFPDLFNLYVISRKNNKTYIIFPKTYPLYLLTHS